MKIGIKVIIFFSIIILLASCSQKREAMGGFAANAEMSMAETADMAIAPIRARDSRARERPAGSGAIDIQQDQLRKLITNSNLRIRLENIEQGADALNAIMAQYGAYAASVSIYENSRNYTLKVPAANYKQFLEGTMVLGKLINFSESTDDVTLQYYDLESRLETKKELLKTYQSYLGKANNIEEILAVESKIAELQGEIDNVGSQFKRLSNLIEYSTIYLELEGPISVTTYNKKTVGEKVKELANGFGGFVSGILIVLLAIVIYGIPSLIILLLLYWVLFGKIGLLKKLFRLLSPKK